MYILLMGTDCAENVITHEQNIELAYEQLASWRHFNHSGGVLPVIAINLVLNILRYFLYYDDKYPPKS